MVKLSKRDLQIIAGIIGATDFYYEGALTAPVSRAIKAAIGRAKPIAARGAMAGARALGSTALRGVGTAAAVGKTIAMRHPVLTAGTVVYYTYQNRDELGGLIEQGYELVQPGLQALADLDAPIVGTRTPKFTKKRMTAFNSAVKKGMSIVKGSTSYGKKGTINNAKKAFSAVTKVASAASKKKKTPKTGIARKIYLGIKGLFK